MHAPCAAPHAQVVDRNGIAMLPLSADPMAGFTHSGRASTEVRVPLRLLGSRVHLLSDAEGEAALSGTESVFVVRYAGGENGAMVDAGAHEPSRDLRAGAAVPVDRAQ